MAKKRYAPKGPLTSKQALFVEEYLKDMNGKQAAIRTGYSAKSAEVQASILLSYPMVSEAVRKEIEARTKRNHMDADEVLQELARLARSNVLDYVSYDRSGGVAIKDSSELTKEQARAIAEVSETVNAQGARQIKFKLHDKIKALSNLAKHLGLLNDKHEITGPGGGPVPAELIIRFSSAKEIRKRQKGADK